MREREKRGGEERKRRGWVRKGRERRKNEKEEADVTPELVDDARASKTSKSKAGEESQAKKRNTEDPRKGKNQEEVEEIKEGRKQKKRNHPRDEWHLSEYATKCKFQDVTVITSRVRPRNPMPQK